MHHHPITFVRHGQCLANAEGRVVGQLDSPLTPLGFSQAEAAAVKLACGPAPVAVIASDLQRAHATARVIAGVLDVPLFTEPDLREQHCGDLEGRLFSELKANSPAPEADSHTVRWGGGESLEDVAARVGAALGRIAQAHHGPVVLVTHGHVIHVALALLAGRGAEGIQWSELPNGGIVAVPDPGRAA